MQIETVEMTKRRSSSVELYVKFNDTKKAGRLLDSLADASLTGHSGKQRKCGALGRLLAAGKIHSIDPLFPTSGYRDGATVSESLLDGMREKDEDARLYVLEFARPEDAKRAATS